MTTHTKGPWAIDSDCTGGVVHAKGGSVVVHEWTYQDCSDNPDFDGEKDDEVAYRNARLIAAAPELLEALKDALCALEVCGTNYDYAMGKARAAIAKAEGKS